jgi:hypothetical protein
MEYSTPASTPQSASCCPKTALLTHLAFTPTAMNGVASWATESRYTACWSLKLPPLLWFKLFTW